MPSRFKDGKKARAGMLTLFFGGLGDGGMVAAGEPFLIEAGEVFGGFGWRAVHFR